MSNRQAYAVGGFLATLALAAYLDYQHNQDSQESSRYADTPDGIILLGDESQPLRIQNLEMGGIDRWKSDGKTFTLRLKSVEIIDLQDD